MRRIGLIGALCATLALVGCGRPTPPQALSDTGAPAADFELADLDGRTVRLSDSQGGVRLVDFWATWCAPCREEVPMLKELQAAYGDRGFKILAISDEPADVVRAFATEHAIGYTNLIDADGAVSGRYDVVGLPTALLIDREGRIVETFLGAKPRRPLERRIRELLELPPES